MNLIEESFQNKEEKKRKTATKIILVAIVLVILIIISIVAYLMYIRSTVLRLTLDGQSNEGLKNILVFEDDGTIYVPIKEVASYFGYESFNGEYSEKSEIQSKCYVQSENEVTNFELGQTKIYKLDLNNNNENYEYYYMKKPVKAINGVLYATTEGIEKAFNVSFQYEKDKNRITIFTMPYLYQFYANKILDYGYVGLSQEFVNQKTVLEDKLIVQKDRNSKQFGVIDINGTAILEPKYDNITYLPNTGDYLVETNRKVGIISSSKETKIDIIYDSIQLMDSDAGLYVAKKDNKYGVIDTKGNIVIYIENDEIGIDISRYSQNNIKNKYILANDLIPVKKDKYWALYDLKGNQVTDFKYDSLGYIASSNRDALNLLVIPNYNVIVVCKDKKYTLVNQTGDELFGIVADDIYMTISGGQRHYYITVNDQMMDAEEYLNRTGITARQTNNTNNTSNTSNTNQTQNSNSNTTSNNSNNEENEQEQNDDNNNDEQNNDNQNEQVNENNQEENQENNQEEQSNENSDEQNEE